MPNGVVVTEKVVKALLTTLRRLGVGVAFCQ